MVFSGTLHDGNKLFRIDVYGGVVSLFASSNAPTGMAADHIFPHVLGGATTVENLALIHVKCNNKKKDRIPHNLSTRMFCFQIIKVTGFNLINFLNY